MSGHSKWSTIKRQKEAADKKRGQVFSKLSRLITLSVKQGGGIADPEKNFKLRLAIDRAKEANMPKENIKRAISRATDGGGKEDLKEVFYERYGPGGVAFMVRVLTDNRNRSVAEIKNIFDRYNGSLAEPGAVSFLFEKKSFLVVEKKGEEEETMLEIIDLGVENVEKINGKIGVYAKPEDLKKVREDLEKKGFKVVEAGFSFEAKSLVFVDDSKVAKKLLDLAEELEEHEDVESVYSNFDIKEELVEELK